MSPYLRRVAVPFFLSCVSLFPVSFCAAEEPPPPSANYLPGQVLVRVQEGISVADVQQVAASVDALAERPLTSWGLYLFRFNAEIPVPEIVEKLKSHPAVRYAEPDYLVSAFSGLGGNPSETLSFSGSPIVVAVLDTGIDFSHPAFADHLAVNSREIAGDGIDNDGNGYVDDVHGYDFVDRDADPSAGPGDAAHGVMVAGRILTGALDAAVKILPLRVGPGPWLSLSAIVEAIQYAADQGARIINMSFGSSFASRAMNEAIQKAADRGVLLVAAAGNSGTRSLSYPAAFQNVVSVAASTASGQKASFSSYGRSVDFTAPGAQVTTTTWGGGTAAVSGTSFSAPFLAGVAARILAADPLLTPAQVIQRLTSYAADVSALNPLYRGLLGAGLINEEVARRIAQAYPLQSNSQEPLPADRQALMSQLALARLDVSRLEASLAQAQQELDGALGKQAAASSGLSAAQEQLRTQWRRYVDAWFAWVRGTFSSTATPAEKALLAQTLSVERDGLLKALSKELDARQQLEVAKSDVKRRQERRTDIANRLAAARQQVDELTRLLDGLSIQTTRLNSQQAQVQQLLLQLHAVQESLRAGPLPDGLAVQEVPEVFVPGSSDSDRRDSRN